MREDDKNDKNSFERDTNDINTDNQNIEQERLRQIQENLLNRQFDLTMINKIFENYEIKNEEEAINYLIPIDGLWMHPFIPKKIKENEINPNNINERMRASLSSIINKVLPNTKCEICGDNIVNHINHNNYEIKSKINSENNSSINEKEKRDNKLCGICMDKIENPIKIPKCKHEFCSDCFTNYILSKLYSNSIESIPCPDHSCKNKELQEDFFLTFLNEDELLRYQSLKIDNEIKKNPNKISCPFCNSYALIDKKNKNKSSNLNISNISKSTNSVNSIPQQKVFCIEKKHEFCSCGRPLHKGKCIDDSIKEYLKTQKVKKCPRCGAYIKKDSGCNHMTCSICKYEFCWLCLKISLPDHYNINGPCAGLQFTDENSVRYRYSNFFNVIFLLLFGLLSLSAYFLFVFTPYPMIFYLVYYELPNSRVFYIDHLKGSSLNLYLLSVNFISFCIVCVYNVVLILSFAFFAIMYLVYDCFIYFLYKKNNNLEMNQNLINLE